MPGCENKGVILSEFTKVAKSKDFCLAHLLTNRCRTAPALTRPAFVPHDSPAPTLASVPQDSPATAPAPAPAPALAPATTPAPPSGTLGV